MLRKMGCSYENNISLAGPGPGFGSDSFESEGPSGSMTPQQSQGPHRPGGTDLEAITSTNTTTADPLLQAITAAIAQHTEASEGDSNSSSPTDQSLEGYNLISPTSEGNRGKSLSPTSVGNSSNPSDRPVSEAGEAEVTEAASAEGASGTSADASEAPSWNECFRCTFSYCR